MTKRGGSDISYYSYDQPATINFGANQSKLYYDGNHQRYKHFADYNGTTETTYYIGGILEKVIKGTVKEYRHLIPGGSTRAIYVRRDDGTNNTYYVTTDQIGSTALVLDPAGNKLATESFAPFGARRKGDTWTGTPLPADYVTFGSTTRRGYTSHEMMDAVSLINMNGRVLDPYSGRPLSVDPIIGDLRRGQSTNPYAYVGNNPLSRTDPSGFEEEVTNEVVVTGHKDGDGDGDGGNGGSGGYDGGGNHGGSQSAASGSAGRGGDGGSDGSQSGSSIGLVELAPVFRTRV